jgi:transketolase
VHSFRQVFDRFPSRIWNMGICEQAMVGAAAGMAKTGLIPIVHTIAPFLCGRRIRAAEGGFRLSEAAGVFRHGRGELRITLALGCELITRPKISRS